MTVLLESAVGGKTTHRVLYAPFSSPLLTTDEFLIDYADYRRSISSKPESGGSSGNTLASSSSSSSSMPSTGSSHPSLHVNQQVRKLFASDDGSFVEWREGSIYHIRPNMRAAPYKAVDVIWFDQELESKNSFPA